MSAEALFSDLLRAYRHASGFSQEALAERAGLSTGAIGALEQGFRRAPRRDTVNALADALDLPEAHRRDLEEAAARARGRQSRGESGIPAPLTSFVDRAEVGDLKALLREHRLLTVTGSGGIGKTRIAMEVARDVEPLYDEAWVVDLLPVRDGSQVAPQIAARLNVPVDGEDGLTAVVQHLRSRHALLVFDNCEHVVDDAALSIEGLLRRCRDLILLVTSREALALSGELAYRLPPMNLKTATDLFIARARAADPRWETDEKRTALVSEICKELDGIPLAIELAASRVPTLGLEALRGRLKGSLNFTGSRDLVARHQTMAATIAWSYDMLGDLERVLFRRLSVFMGGFTVEAAEQICADESLPVDTVAEALSLLVRKSLVNVEHVDTSTRYRFLEPIRAFAWERLLESGELENTMLHFISYLRQKAAVLDFDPPAELLVGERVELDNARFAINWAESTLHHTTIASATHVLIGFRNVWFGAGRQIEFRTLAFRLRQQIKEEEHPEVAGLLVHAMAGFVTGPELLTLSERAIPLLVAAGHRARAADLHARCASACCMRGDAASAENHIAAGEALLDPEERHGSRAGFSFATHGAYVRVLLKNFQGARALLDASEVPDRESVWVDVQVLRALIEHGEGRLGDAIAILTNAKPGIERHSNAKHLTVLVCGNLAGYHLLSGNTEPAEAELRQALSAAVDMRDFWLTTGIAILGRYAAFFAATSGRAELGARLLGACDQRSDPASLEDDAEARDLAARAIEKRLSPEQTESLRRIGASEDMYELVEEFLAV